MHNLLSAASRKQYNRAYFVNRYTAIGEMATLQSVDVGLAPGSGEASQLKTQPLNIPIRVGMKTRRVGDIAETNVLPLVNEGGAWKVVWSPSLIFKDLSGNNLVRMYPQTPTRGGIYDRDGNPLAIDGQIAQLGVVPGQIKNETELLQRVSEALGVSRTYVKQRYSGGQPEWFMPISDLSAKEAADLRQKLANLAGVTFSERSGRVYPQGALMAQIIGYVGPIFAEDLEKPAYADYTANDVVGRTGLESWGETYLRGKPGGRLAIVAPDERLVKVVKEQTVQFGANIYLNIDINLQAKAEREMESKKLSGSVVALNPNNGEILTLVSQPSFDPNEFVTGISQARYAELTAPEARNPFQNRATGSSYPIASTFKPITMAAALTLPLAGVTTKIWVSDGTWNRDGGAVRGDWKAGGHGSVNLQQGITESVDTVFYDLGYELYQRDINYLTEFTKKWWFGRLYGVDGTIEADGLVPGPGNPFPGWGPGDNVNLAIGQGALRASPLQVANFYATVGNGGTIYRPNLINRIVSAENSNNVVKAYPPTVVGKAPVSADTLARMQRSLKTVTMDLKGTAYYVFKGSPIQVAGKTGTGQQDKKDPYAWFAGYASADKPTIAIVAVAENAGEGSSIAAPIVRSLMESYLRPPAARP